MHGYAQSRTFPATALLYVAALLRSAAYRVRAAARPADAGNAETRTQALVLRDPRGTRYRELDGLAHLDMHVLKDIGAPHWLVARAAREPEREHLRWIELEHR
jgi:hypothetical protein